MNKIDLEIGGASATIWLDETPQYKDTLPAVIGNFQATDSGSGLKLLDESIKSAKQAGAQFLIGPMDKNTWNRYRFVIESDNSPPFLMEPSNPEFYPDLFIKKDFQIIASYQSARAEKQAIRNNDRYEKLLATKGIRIRNFVISDAKAELEKLYDLSLASFKNNFLYTPITKATFLAMYEPLIDKLVDQFILMAEDENGVLQAYAFAIPDYAQGSSPDQLIIKTYASRFTGLGGYLADQLHLRAWDSGFTSVIHALMKEDNNSLNYSKRYATTFRRYALFGKELL